MYVLPSGRLEIDAFVADGFAICVDVPVWVQRSFSVRIDKVYWVVLTVVVRAPLRIFVSSRIGGGPPTEGAHVVASAGVVHGRLVVQLVPRQTLRHRVGCRFGAPRHPEAEHGRALNSLRPEPPVGQYLSGFCQHTVLSKNFSFLFLAERIPAGFISVGEHRNFL